MQLLVTTGELGRPLRDDEVTVLEGWAGDLYGIPVDSTVEAIRLSGRLARSLKHDRQLSPGGHCRIIVDELAQRRRLDETLLAP